VSGSVETVRGPVALDALGRTLMHEHVVLLSPEALANFGLHIPTTILPALLEAGVTQAQIDQMLLENPRRFFRVGA
jgi:predicted metal-dependent phosphotriesterase family hydrolase